MDPGEAPLDRRPRWPWCRRPLPRRMRCRLESPAERFSAELVGLDDEVAGADLDVVFKVWSMAASGGPSAIVRPDEAAKPVDIALHGGRLLWLIVEDAGNGCQFDHADWADARIIMREGTPAMIAPERARLLAALDHSTKTWTLQSGGVQYQLRQSGLGIDVPRFAPAATASPAEPGRLLSRPPWPGRRP